MNRRVAGVGMDTVASVPGLVWIPVWKSFRYREGSVFTPVFSASPGGFEPPIFRMAASSATIVADKKHTPGLLANMDLDDHCHAAG